MRLFYATMIIVLIIHPERLCAQAQDKRVALKVSRATGAIKVDGVADEAAWSLAESTSPFLNKWPLDTGYSATKTEVKMLFNDQYIYLSAINHQKREDLVIQTLKRDQMEPYWASDGFSVLIDPMNQKQAGFLFAVNAGGAQLDGFTTLVGSFSRTNENWDNKWVSATKVYDAYWTVEMAIPFAALRFKSGASEWGLNFIRNDMKSNSFSTWSRVPQQLGGTDLGHTGSLQWAEPITPEKSIVTLIPYVSGGQSRNHEDLEAAKTSGNAGLDMKVAVSSSMNLDLTLRPDFSNVEVDRQMTNVTRFSLLFPERRNFFLENADLFTNFGSWLVRPFFSRRIGLYDGHAIPILAGARLSGNVTSGLRIGVMDVQTEATKEFSANNYLVASAQQRVFSRSSVKLYGANRQTTKSIEGDVEQDFNRTYGAEFQYVSKKGNLSGYLRAHAAQTPEKLHENKYLSAQLNYIDKRFYTGLMLEEVEQNYQNDLGFIPRLYNYDATSDTTVRIGHYTINPWAGLLIYPKKSKTINLIEPNTWSVINYRSSGEFLERNTSVNLAILFKDTRRLFIEAFNTSVNLPFAADIIDSDNPIPVGRYDYTQYSMRYTTDSRKALSSEVSVGYGEFYNGTRMEYGATLNFRRQPWGVFGISYLQNDIKLPVGYGETSFQLIGPRAEISLRHNMWWTTFLQYNTQQENFNINSRFQWRFKPMSDFFIVYTDNYTTTDMKVKNRGVVFKVTYWLNL
ncbi:MAG: DUF5916 domain-containing protein [Bacteroidota bacterium]